MKFTKLHGCGNGYIYVNLFEEKLDNPAEMAIKVSDCHFGIGSDGLITIGPSEIADFTMHIYNADGSEAEMCGNGVRCVGKYVYDHGLTDKTEVAVETGAGIKIQKLLWTEETFWEWNGKKVHGIDFYYLAEAVKGCEIPDNGEFVSQKDNCNVLLGWMPIEKMKNITIYPEFVKEEINCLDGPPKHFVSR